VKSARFVLSCHSVGTSLPEIALSAWMSASSFAGSPRCTFTLTRNVTAPAVVLFRSSSTASSKMSASGAPTNVAFPPSPTHLYTALCSTWLSHKYSMGFVTGVPSNAKTKAASSGWFELNPSSSRPTFLCCLFLSFRRFTYPAPILPPFWVRSITRRDCTSEAVSSRSADLCAHSAFPLDTCQSYLTFVLSARRPRCCQQRLNLFCLDSEIFLNPA